jgi:hypothetical protein
MIIIQPLNGTPAEGFENYGKLFDCLTSAEAVDCPEEGSAITDKNWGFTVYPPQRVAVLYAHDKDPPEAMKEAFEDHLSLIEICAGDYKRPLYIVLNPNVDMDYLKKKWCVDYCTWHHIVVREV